MPPQISFLIYTGSGLMYRQATSQREGAVESLKKSNNKQVLECRVPAFSPYPSQCLFSWRSAGSRVLNKPMVARAMLNCALHPRDLHSKSHTNYHAPPSWLNGPWVGLRFGRNGGIHGATKIIPMIFFSTDAVGHCSPPSPQSSPSPVYRMHCQRCSHLVKIRSES